LLPRLRTALDHIKLIMYSGIDPLSFPMLATNELADME